MLSSPLSFFPPGNAICPLCVGNSSDLLIKTNFHGIIEWEKTFGGSMWEVGTAAIELTGGGYLVAGFSNLHTGAGLCRVVQDFHNSTHAITSRAFTDRLTSNLQVRRKRYHRMK